MIRHPPRSPLFPYPTLCRSILDHYRNPHGRGLREPFEAEVHHVNPTCGDEVTLRVHLEGETVADVSYRSEEHTSELQSRQYLACRLLLEKNEDIDQQAVHFV